MVFLYAIAYVIFIYIKPFLENFINKQTYIEYRQKIYGIYRKLGIP